MIKTQINEYDSSTVESSTYNLIGKTLCVEFKHATYEYLNVEHDDYLLFSTADSQGIALNAFIKGKYEYLKLENHD
jgi:hypothetical protein